jgi:hypothetical protein
MGRYKVVFYNGFNTSTETKLVVCVDKDWGVPGCGIRSDGVVEGDWVHDGISTYNSSVETPYFNPVAKLIIEVTSPCDDYRVEVKDEDNNVVLTTRYDGRICSPFPFFVPTPTPTPTPSAAPGPEPSQGCSPLISTGVAFLDAVVFCVGGVGITVFILMLLFLLLLLRRSRRSRG